MMEERPLPWLRMPKAAVIVVVFTGFAAAMAWLFAGNDPLLSLSIFAGVAVATLIYNRQRCPKCGGSLALRRKREPRARRNVLGERGRQLGEIDLRHRTTPRR